MAYASLAELKTYVGVSDAVDDTVLGLALDAAARGVDRLANRTFDLPSSATPRRFVTRDAFVLHIPDIASTTGLTVKTDTDGDGVFETTWSDGDYQTEPDGDPTRPITALRAVGDHVFSTYFSGRFGV